MYDHDKHGRLSGSAKAAITFTTTVALASGIGAVTMTTDAKAADQATSTTGLSVRSGPSKEHRVIGALKTGQKIATAGPSKSGWTPINYDGQTAYVSAKYLKVSRSGNPDVSEPGETPATTSSSKTTTALNVRTGPALTYRSVTILAKGTQVALTGKTSRGYSEVVFQGAKRWVSTRYLSNSGTPSTDPTPSKKTSKGIATADLLIRSSSSSKYKVIRVVPKGSELALTGVVKNNRAQVVDQKVLRWVNNTYVRPIGPKAPSGNLPKVAKHMYATVALDIRSASKNSYTLTEVPAGTKLALTGVYADGRAQIIYGGALRWVTSKYLTPKKGPNITSSSRGISGLRPSTKYLMSRVQAEFPRIVTFYGVRPDSIPDHPSGKALDIMLPSYRSNRAMGQTIADWARANSQELNIEYIIFNQRIWNYKRDREGWRYMASRGSDTANHKDHVHITVLD